MQLQGRSYTPVLLFLVTLGCVGAVFCTSGEHMFSPGDLKAHGRRQTSLGGVHAHGEIQDCAACHVPAWSKETMADRCLSCHQDVRAELHAGGPLHGKLANAQQCRDCHTEHRGSTAALTNLARFDHDCAAFPLTGKHRGVECQDCHTETFFKGTSHACVSCHVEPKVHLGKFGTPCQYCHTTTSWQGASVGPAGLANFDHGATSFPLTGKHASVDCKSCHAGNVFKGTSPACVSCHAEPKVHLGKFGNACAGCHSTATWKGAALTRTALAHFDHNTTAFKLTGKHTAVECASCHVDNVFKGTAQTCVSCHAEPKVHLGKFGGECASCHSTTSWKGAVFAHKFPINHGNKRGNDCATCHKTSEYKVYTCYGCHQHEPTKIARKHREVRFRPGVSLAQCAHCHANGKEKRRAAGAVDDAVLALLGVESSGCPTGLDVLSMVRYERFPLDQQRPARATPDEGRMTNRPDSAWLQLLDHSLSGRLLP